MNQDYIDRAFKYHAPKGDQPQRYSELRSWARSLADKIDVFCPDSNEKRIAFEKLEECVMWANAAIARNE